MAITDKPLMLGKYMLGDHMVSDT